MIKLLRKLFDFSFQILEKYPCLKPFKSVLDAADGFFFGTDEVTSGPPHLRDNIDLKRYMIMVLIAVLPALFAGTYLFGPRVLALVMISYIFGGIVELAFALVRKHEINEGFLITGIIYALILPPTTPFWMAAVGAVVGVTFGKEVFGGTGKNIFNPAMVGRLFLAIAFPVEMTTKWKVPLADAITSATPLMSFKSTGELVSNWSLLIGNVPGSIGETCKILIILGGIFLLLTKVANWRIPVSCLATVAVLSYLFHGLWPQSFGPPLFQLLSGGLLFGVFFMATDPVTSPFTQGARWAYGIILGALIICIRGFSGYVEGVMFAVVFMNIFAPLFDQIVLSWQYRNGKQ